jgi:hypothetical protein
MKLPDTPAEMRIAKPSGNRNRLKAIPLQNLIALEFKFVRDDAGTHRPIVAPGIVRQNADVQGSG